MYDYVLDRMKIDGIEYSLSEFRVWLFKNHADICNNYMVRTIIKGNRRVMTYDWQHIYFIANEYSLTKQFINEKFTEGSVSFPTDSASDQKG